MLEEMGYDSDPVKAWKQSQEKVGVGENGFQLHELGIQPAEQNDIVYLLFRMRRRQRMERGKKQKRTTVDQTIITC